MPLLLLLLVYCVSCVFGSMRKGNALYSFLLVPALLTTATATAAAVLTDWNV